jgi:hypothetical protein
MSTVLTEPAPDPLWRRVIAGPATRGGRLSAWITGAVMGVLALIGGLSAAGVPDKGWGVRLALGLTGLFAVATAVVAGGIAVRAIRYGERSVVLLAPLLFGGVCLIFLVGELLFPH